MNPPNAKNIESKDAIGQTLFRYFASVDDKAFDEKTFSGIFARDGKIIRPNGQAVTGAKAIFESQEESFKRFRATQHIVSNLLFEESPEGWTVRANLQAMHLWAPESLDPTSLDSYFLAHSVMRAVCIHEDGAWKIGELSVKPVWRSGSGFNTVLKTR